MDIQHKKVTIKELIDLYEDIRFIFSDSYKKIVSLGYDDSKDSRNMIYKLWIEASQTNVILFHLIGEHFGNLELWNLQKFSSEEQKEEFLRDRLGFIIGDLRENLFVNVFLRLENFIKLISRSQNIVGEKINKLSKDLIDKLNLNSDFKNLIDLTTYLRNTIHTEGFHTKNNVTIIYKGKDFDFFKDMPVTFYNEDFLFFLIKELDILVFEIINSQQIKSILLIEHNFSGLNHIYEE
jgi:hypothetical protein